MTTEAIITIPPYAPYIKDVARHPLVSGVRINTVMPIKEPLEKIKDDVGDKDVWIDLGYKRFMIGDDICFHKESVLGALNLLHAIARDQRQPDDRRQGLTRADHASTKTS